MTNHIKFRYDFPEDESFTDMTPYMVIYRLLKVDTAMPTGVVGIESKNKYGEEIKKHMHFHFISDEKLETIRRRFTRSAVEGKKDSYSLALEKDVIDDDRFFRYPLKQYSSPFVYPFSSRIPAPTGFDFSIQQLLANEEWEKGKQILSKNRVKSDSRLTTYEKIIDLIEENSILFFGISGIRHYILQYYLDNNIPPNRSKIIEMSDGIAIRQKIISFDDYFEGR